jgi:hypothetical protein
MTSTTTMMTVMTGTTSLSSTTHRQHQHHQHAETSMAAARDETRLKPLVCFFFLFYYANVYFGYIYLRMHQAWQGRETRAKQGGSRRVASRAQCVCRHGSVHHIIDAPSIPRPIYFIVYVFN